jgi:hypothetical protein
VIYLTLQNLLDLPRHLAAVALAVTSAKDAPETMVCYNYSESPIVELHFSMKCLHEQLLSMEGREQPRNSLYDTITAITPISEWGLGNGVRDIIYRKLARATLCSDV